MNTSELKKTFSIYKIKYSTNIDACMKNIETQANIKLWRPKTIQKIKELILNNLAKDTKQNNLAKDTKQKNIDQKDTKQKNIDQKDTKQKNIDQNNSKSLYKIRINCTSTEELNFNNKKICKKEYNNIHDKLQPNDIIFIESVIILHKQIYKQIYKQEKPIIIKSLEFICNQEINKIMFQDFINKMKNSGFNSIHSKIDENVENNQINKNNEIKLKKNNTIQFIEIIPNISKNKTETKIIFNYDFNLCIEIPEIKRKKNKNKLTYSQQILYNTC